MAKLALQPRYISVGRLSQPAAADFRPSDESGRFSASVITSRVVLIPLILGLSDQSVQHLSVQLLLKQPGRGTDGPWADSAPPAQHFSGDGKAGAFMCRKCMAQASILVLDSLGVLLMTGLIKALVHFRRQPTTQLGPASKARACRAVEGDVAARAVAVHHVESGRHPLAGDADISFSGHPMIGGIWASASG